MEQLLYIHHYGDQHATKDVRTISDGGSNIHVHLIKRLEKKFIIIISTYAENFISKNYFSRSKRVKIIEHFTLSGLFKRNILFTEFALRCLYPGLKYLFFPGKFTYIVSQTDFLPDVLPALFIKLRRPRTIWVASYFLEAPKPWDKNSPYKGVRWLIGLSYWLLQRLSYLIIKSRADFVLVTSQPDVARFITGKRDQSKVLVAQGGVDVEPSKKYLRSGKVIPLNRRKYDAVFVGRFHYQKGVLELLDIWKRVCEGMPSVRLAMIGSGPLGGEVRQKIDKLKLQKNVDLLGYLSGNDKFEIFKQSKVVVHPATYDSGGMAAAEALGLG